MYRNIWTSSFAINLKYCKTLMFGPVLYLAQRTLSIQIDCALKVFSLNVLIKCTKINLSQCLNLVFELKYVWTREFFFVLGINSSTITITQENTLAGVVITDQLIAQMPCRISVKKKGSRIINMGYIDIV